MMKQVPDNFDPYEKYSLCTCPRDGDGELEVFLSPDEDGKTVRHYFFNPYCPVHGLREENE